jgi:hypothetical protein
MTMGEKDQVENTRASLVRVQTYKPEGLARTADLGTALSFTEIVPAAKRIVELYKRVPESILEDLIPQHLNQIQSTADADFNRFKQIEDFDPDKSSNAAEERRQLITSLTGAYDQTFSALWSFIAYGVAKVTDSCAGNSCESCTAANLRSEFSGR